VSPQEGKTVTSVNLAMTIAQSENKVLLIDGDLRRPRVHEVFGLDNSTGLSTYLAGASDLDIIHDSPVANLKVIASGPIPPNPSELLSSSRLKKLIGELHDSFDLILWDSAPILTVTDSLILSSVLDGTVVVTRSGKSTYEDVRRGIRSLNEVETHFLGIVINGFEPKKGDRSYGYYSNYYSHTHIQDRP
jgi:capsular exopolysaccharide synthesis family protein